jgi:ribosomal protein S18 acetylase RimI-like enzyme
MMIEIRLATIEDCGFLAKVCRSVSALYDPIMPGAFEKQAVKYEAGGLPKNYEVYIISLEGQPIGFVGLKDITEEIAYLPALYFPMEQQRKGQGRQTVNVITDMLEQRGIKEIVLLVHKDAHWAVNFYKNNGFEVITEDLEEIMKYANCNMEAFALPGTILMTRRL